MKVVYLLPKTSRRRTLFLVAIMHLIFCAVIIMFAAASEPPPVKRVLILHSFGRDFAPYAAASSSFRTELAQQAANPIEFLEASLETARFIEGGSETPFVEYLRALFADRPPHLLVPFGAPAMNFLIRHRDALFPGVPLLVGAVDKRRLSAAHLGANATAVGVDLDLPAIIDNVLRVLPSTRNIEVVIGNSPLERFWLAELREDFQAFTNRVSFNWLSELSFEEMRKHVGALPPNTAIFYALLLVDAAGVPHEQDSALEVLHRESKAPIFGAFDSQLGRGIVGGPLYPVQQVSSETARLAVRILKGESPESMQPVLLDSATPVYDWRELKRWNIKESRLPPASVIQYREPTFWEQYRWYIIAALAIVAMQAALIGDLLLERARRRRTAAVLSESEENLRRLVETTAAVPWQADAETWVFNYVGPQAGKLLGYPLEQWYEKDFWVSHLHPDDKELAINTCLSNSARTENFAFEYRMIAASGESVWMHDIVHCERPNGQPGQLRGFMLDITERKRAEAELRRNREELAHLTRIYTMGELATSLAHELNQPLTAILSNAQAAQRFLSANPADVDEVREILQDIVQDNNRAGEVIRRMRALVKKEKLEISSLDLATLIGEIVALVHSDAVLRNARVSLDFTPDLPPVRGDKVELQQVLLNLLLNAFDAMRDAAPEERDVVVRMEADGAGMVEVSVSDRGTGLTSDKLDKIFQPFFTTKKEGLGMGLSISRAIIEAHGGKLWAENNAGRGATFYFTLPRSDPQRSL